MATLSPPPLDNTVEQEDGKFAPPWARWLQLLWDAMRTLQATFAWDPGNLADGTGETSAAVTVTGAAFGDVVLVGAPYDLQGIICTGYVSAADTLRVRLQNETGGAINLASGDWKVRVVKQIQ
jgi:hypothetical protein